METHHEGLSRVSASRDNADILHCYNTHTLHYMWTCSRSAQEPSNGRLKVNFSLLTLLSTSSLLLCLSLVARAANCCSRAGLGGVVMSRKYWKACEMVQGGIRLSLVQLLITPGGRRGGGGEEGEGRGGRESGGGRHSDF